MNPLAFCYGDLTGIEAYFCASAVLVTGRTNRNDPRFQTAREAGAEVYAYINVCNIPQRMAGGDNGLDSDFYNGFAGNRLWPFASRIDYVNSFTTYRLADLREGSPWSSYCIEYILNLRGSFDGVFLDSFGSRRWNQNAAWETWPVDEQQRWTAGVIDFARSLRVACGEDFILVANSIWDEASQAQVKDALDGSCIEHHPVTRPSAVQAAARRYRPHHPRCFWIALKEEAELAAALPGVTHVSVQHSYTAAPPAPALDFTDLRLREAYATIERISRDNRFLRVQHEGLRKLHDETLGRIERAKEAAIAALGLLP